MILFDQIGDYDYGEWTIMDILGFIPCFMDERDDDNAVKQIDKNYQHCGGWHAFTGFKIINERPMTIQYPGDPPLVAIAVAQLRDETIYVFPHSWVMVMQPDNSWEIARVD